MKAYLELYASLMPLLPPGTSRHRRQVEVDEDCSLQDVLDRFRIPEQQAHIVLRNGLFVCGEDRRNTRLEEGDTIAVWPPVAGG
jgi:sulfur carrier protein ThiS